MSRTVKLTASQAIDIAMWLYEVEEILPRNVPIGRHLAFAMHRMSEGCTPRAAAYAILANNAERNAA